MKELSAPAGYNKINTLFEIFISGHGLTVSNGEEEGNIPFIVTNKKTPPEDPEDPEDPEEPEEEIEVEGLSDIKMLAFTGMNLVFPVAGAAILMVCIGLFLWTSAIRKRNWKHAWKNK
jgi:hypothetical protein